jgi:uncharacterized membrane protein
MIAVQVIGEVAERSGVAQSGAVEGAGASPVAVEFVSRRNCSLSPRALMAVFGSAVAVSFAFGVMFAAAGAWLVLPFAGVELLALAAAFVVYGRHATDGERLRFTGEALSVEVTQGPSVRVYEFDARLVRLLAEDGVAGGGRSPLAGRRLFLSQRATRLEVGRHLDARRRAELEKDLRAALLQAARWQGSIN